MSTVVVVGPMKVLREYNHYVALELMPKKERVVMNDNLLSYDKFIELAKTYGYAAPVDEADGQVLYKNFLEHIEIPVRDAVRVSIIESDNRGKTVLDTTCLDAVKNQVRIFPTTK